MGKCHTLTRYLITFDTTTWQFKASFYGPDEPFVYMWGNESSVWEEEIETEGGLTSSKTYNVVLKRGKKKNAIKSAKKRFRDHLIEHPYKPSKGEF